MLAEVGWEESGVREGPGRGGGWPRVGQVPRGSFRDLIWRCGDLLGGYTAGCWVLGIMEWKAKRERRRERGRERGRGRERERGGIR